MAKDTRRGRSRASQNRAMRKELENALRQVFKECLRVGWYGQLTLQASVEDGILQQEYVITTRRTYRLT
jgi:hypothetical protein